MNFSLLRVFLLSICLCVGTTLKAQHITITGAVSDTGRIALEGVNIIVKGTDIDTTIFSDENGDYTVSFYGYADSVIFVLPNYEKYVARLSKDSFQIVNAYLNLSENSLNEVTIGAKKKGRYRNKNNPAVELIRLVIDHKEENSVSHYNTASYTQYEKLQIGTNHTPKYIRYLPFIHKYSFLFDNIDTTSIPGKSISPIYIEETISQEYYRKNPEKKRAVITAHKQVAFDRRYVDKDVFNVYIRHLYRDIDIYQNDISVVTNTFLSPIANTAPSFYKFYIMDTVEQDGIKLIRLDFEPRNKKDFLFYGTLYITLDGKYGVQHAELVVGKNVNLNWVSDLHIDLNFEKSDDGHYHISKCVMSAFFSVMNGKRGMYGSRTAIINDFKINPSLNDTVFTGANDKVEKIDSIQNALDTFWKSQRPEALTATEATAYKNMDSLIHMKSFRRLMGVANTLIVGYQNLHQVEIGPIYSLYSFNNLEGIRTRLGLRTTDELSKSFYGEAYGAYGFRDEKFKYMVRGAYAFNHKSIYTYPQHYVRVGYMQDAMVPGQGFQYSSADNFLLSFQRGENNSFVYNKNFMLEYMYEFANIMGFSAQFSRQDLTAAGALDYVRNADVAPDTVNHITTADIGFGWSWKPHQKFVQRKYYRTAMPNKYPAISLNINIGIKGLWGADFDYQSFRLNIDKRFYLSQLGFADVNLNGGYIFGTLPYPLLSVPPANQSYVYQLSAFNLMNYSEFVTDQYASLRVDYHMMGFILNKIPLIKKLNLREVFSYKMMYGGLRDENDPALNHNLFAFPKDKEGNTIVNKFTNEPYIEAGFGIDNIFNMFRVDVIKRFGYLHHSHVNTWGVRAMFSLDF